MKTVKVIQRYINHSARLNCGLAELGKSVEYYYDIIYCIAVSALCTMVARTGYLEEVLGETVDQV